VPAGYHGRAGTVVVSGTPVRRPWGQYPGDDGVPAHAPTRALDLELELGFVVGVPSTAGEPVAVDRALEHLFGVVLLDDWSARDLQAWEGRPLGPLLSKSFATTIGAWVTPLEALAPYRVPVGREGPEPLEYLREDPWAYDLDLSASVAGDVVARTSARHLHWSIAQQVAHLTANGAPLRTGDLLGTGTISGPGDDEAACLLERGGPYLADGDEVVLRGATPDGAVVLAEARGTVLPARPRP
jgi:fumarylacetoacetase